MKKKGKELEQLVKAHRLSANKNSDTSITANAKMKDSNGIKREIDVLEVSINNDKTSYECKETGRRVNIQTIDAVKGKFDDMPEISHRKVVSEKGYSKNAKIKAQKNNIELYENIKLDNHDIMEKEVSMYVPIPIEVEFVGGFKFDKKGMPIEIADNPNAFPMTVTTENGDIIKIIKDGWINGVNGEMTQILVRKYLSLGQKPFIETMTLKSCRKGALYLCDALGGKYVINEATVNVTIDCVIKKWSHRKQKSCVLKHLLWVFTVFSQAKIIDLNF